MEEETNNSLEKVIQRLEVRSKENIRDAQYFQISIYTLLLFGVFFIIFADWISELGKEKEKSFEQLQVQTVGLFEEAEIRNKRSRDTLGMIPKSLVDLIANTTDIKNYSQIFSDKSYYLFDIESKGHIYSGDAKYIISYENFAENYFDNFSHGRDSRGNKFVFNSPKDSLDYFIHPIISEFRQEAYDSLIKEANDSQVQIDSLLKYKPLLDKKVLEENIGITSRTILSSQSVLSADFIRSTITRFGTLILIFFLVRILIPQYRYKLKLSTFYAAKADALILFGSDEIKNVTKLDSLFINLNPEVNFGKEPETPIEKIIELARVITGK